MARDLHGHRAQGRALELLAVLPRRGLGRGQPLALHRRGAEGGAEVLPRHAAGRRGAPRGLLQALHARGGRRRHGDIALGARGDPARADLGLSQDLREARPGRRRAAPRPLAAQVRAGDHDVPPGRRGGARAAGPALHRELPDRARPPAGLRGGHEERLARRAAPHRLRRQGALGADPRGPRVQGRRRRSAERGDGLHDRRAPAAELGPPLHGVLRLHARGHLRRGLPVVRDEDAHRRAAAGGDPVRASDPARARPEGARRARDQAARGGLCGREERPARARPRVDGAPVRLDPALRAHGPRAGRDDDPVGLLGRGALVPADRQRLDERRAGPPRRHPT